MLHFHIQQCSIQNRYVHISVLNSALWDMEKVHSGICELGWFCNNLDENKIIFPSNFRGYRKIVKWAIVLSIILSFHITTNSAESCREPQLPISLIIFPLNVIFFLEIVIAIVPTRLIQSQRNVAQTKTAQLSWFVQHFVVIGVIWVEIYFNWNLKLDWNFAGGMGVRPQLWD